MVVNLNACVNVYVELYGVLVSGSSWRKRIALHEAFYLAW